MRTVEAATRIGSKAGIPASGRTPGQQHRRKQQERGKPGGDSEPGAAAFAEYATRPRRIFRRWRSMSLAADQLSFTAAVSRLGFYAQIRQQRHAERAGRAGVPQARS